MSDLYRENIYVYAMRIAKLVFYIVVALVVAYLWVHFEAQHYGPFHQ